MIRLIICAVILPVTLSCASLKPRVDTADSDTKVAAEPTLAIAPKTSVAAVEPLSTPPDAGLPHWAQNQTVFQETLIFLSQGKYFQNGKSPMSTLALFDVEKFNLPTLVEQEVSALVVILKLNPAYKVVLSGHTDNDENGAVESANSNLRELRVGALISELRIRGVTPDQIASTLRVTPIKLASRNQRLLRAVVAELVI